MFITPNPKKHVRNDGELVFEKTLCITLPFGYEDIVSTMTELFCNYTADKLSLSFVFSEKLSGTAYIAKEKSIGENADGSGYEYELHINEEYARLVFSDKTGLIHALVSFLQLIRIGENDITVPCYSIWDKPDIPFRALHVCVFKNTSLSFLKKVFGLCGMMKMTHIVLEFWGTYRYECMPSLSWKGSYTKADIQPLVKYANGLGMEIIPMLNHLGHASQGRISLGKHSALDNDISLAYLFEDDGWSWCTTNEKTKELLAKCRRELIELCGEGKYFHIGFDEAYTFGSCERCRKFDRNELLKEHLINITNDLLSLGRRPVMWADMMLDSTGFDRKIYEINDNGEHIIRKALPREIIMADWQYNCRTEDFRTSEQLRADGFDVVTCPWDSKENVRCAADTVRHGGLLGVIGTTWHTLPRMEWLIPFLADTLWGEVEVKDISQDIGYHLTAAYHYRRCVPANGVYEEAGFKEDELPPINF